ncbi:hypothetical protein [Deinococcus frigens]
MTPQGLLACELAATYPKAPSLMSQTASIATWVIGVGAGDFAFGDPEYVSAGLGYSHDLGGTGGQERLPGAVVGAAALLGEYRVAVQVEWQGLRVAA